MHAHTYARQEVYAKIPTFCRRDTRRKRKGHRDTEGEKGKQTHPHKVVEETGRNAHREVNAEKETRTEKGDRHRKEVVNSVKKTQIRVQRCTERAAGVDTHEKTHIPRLTGEK